MYLILATCKILRVKNQDFLISCRQTWSWTAIYTCHQGMCSSLRSGALISL